MDPQHDSKCVECGETAPPTAPHGLCVVCFQKSTGLGPEDYRQSTTIDEASTIPARPTPKPDPGKDSTSRILQPDQTFGQGRFTLVRQLGKGGMGEVWLAKDRDLTEGGAPCLVALKFLTSDIRHDPKKLNWLRREVLASRNLNHDNIVKVFDLHTASPTEPPFLAMEYVEGATLEDRLLKKPKRFFPWDDLRPFARQICAALEHAHDRGIFHRDLKPRNILVASNSDETKLADFGLARRLSATESDGSRMGSGAGTRGYMSPQQAAGHTPTRFDDIYALGATLYRLLTGELPEFRPTKSEGKSSLTLIPVSERLAAKGLFSVPDHVERTLQQCLEADATKRPDTIYEVAAGLGIAGHSQPPGPGERTLAARPRKGSSLAVKLAGLGVLAALLAYVVLQPEFRTFLDRVMPRNSPRPRAEEPLPRPTVVLSPTPETQVHAAADILPASNPASPAATTVVSELPPPAPSPTPSAAAPEAEKPEPPIPSTPGPHTGRRWTNSIGMEFHPVPLLRVLVSRFETRVADFRQMVPKHPAASFQSVGASNQPVVHMTWVQATNFCRWLTEQERKDGLLGPNQEYRLPTVAEWMRAANAPSEEPKNAGQGGPRALVYLWGSEWPPLPKVGNLLGDETLTMAPFANREDRIRHRTDGAGYTAPSGLFPPNAHDLSDMIGNVWELCLDGPSTGQCWSVGGSFNTGSRKELSVGYRRQASTRQSRTEDWDVGFRCVLDPGPAEEPTPRIQIIR